MTCLITAPCGGQLVEDREFAREAPPGLRVRFFRCVGAGHTHRKPIMGRPAKGHLRVLACSRCGRDFERYFHPADQVTDLVYCGGACRGADAPARAVTTNTSEAVRLYQEGFSMPAVGARLGCSAHAVRLALDRARVSRRRRTNTTRCVWPECTAVPWKRRSSTGSLFGRRCRPHELRYLARRRAKLPVPA